VAAISNFFSPQLLDLFCSNPTPVVCCKSSAMAIPESWRLLEQAILLQQATRFAKDVLNKDGDLRFKQKQLQHFFTDVDINRKPFDCIYTELEDQMDDIVLGFYNEVWRVEVTMAAEDAEKDIAMIAEANGFQTAEIEVISGYVISKLAVTKQMRKISEASSDIEEAVAIAHAAELSLLENAVKVNLQKLLKSETARQQKADSIVSSSPQEASKGAHKSWYNFVSPETSLTQQDVLTGARLHQVPYYNFPYKVFSDDDASLPLEIPDGLRCGCPLGCIKLMQYCSSLEIAMGKCHGCKDCKGRASVCECFCECLACEQAYIVHIAKIRRQSAFKDC
jgi:hypothetical protein